MRWEVWIRIALDSSAYRHPVVLIAFIKRLSFPSVLHMFVQSQLTGSMWIYPRDLSSVCGQSAVNLWGDLCCVGQCVLCFALLCFYISHTV